MARSNRRALILRGRALTIVCTDRFPGKTTRHEPPSLGDNERERARFGKFVQPSVGLLSGVLIELRKLYSLTQSRH
jgi:hypothetical protein